MSARAIFALKLSLAVWAGLVLTDSAAGQTGLATVTGIVRDATGGAVPGVTVTATNQATNVAYTAVTNNAGNYIMTSVPIGTYVVAADLEGFKGMQSTVTLTAAQTARVDFALEVGTVDEQIEVVATGAVLQTENAVVGNTIEREQIEKLPAQGRNLSTASLYTAGVVTPNPNSFNSLKNTTGGRPFVNGQREQGNNFTLDGVDMNDAIDNLVAYQPSPDAVEQVRIETNNYSPELGNVAGGIVNMVMKSGTNDFAGNGFYYWRDNELAATPWATNRAGGQVSGKGRGSLSTPWTHLQHRVGFYAADDIKATDNLTLNVGLRWGYTSPLVEKDDRARLEVLSQHGVRREHVEVPGHAGGRQSTAPWHRRSGRLGAGRGAPATL